MFFTRGLIDGVAVGEAPEVDFDAVPRRDLLCGLGLAEEEEANGDHRDDDHDPKRW